MNSQLELAQLEFQETDEEVQAPLDYLQNLSAWVWLLTGGFISVIVMSYSGTSGDCASEPRPSLVSGDSIRYQFFHSDYYTSDRLYHYAD